MTSRDERGSAWLESLGIAKEFHDQLRDDQKKDLSAPPTTIVGFPPGALIAVLAVFGLFAWLVSVLFLGKHYWHRAHQAAIQYDSVLVHNRAGGGLLLILLAFVIFLCWYYVHGAQLYRVRGALVAAAKMFAPPDVPKSVLEKVLQKASWWLLRFRVHRASPFCSLDQLYQRVAHSRAMLLATAWIVVLALGTGLAVLDTSNFWVVTSKAIIEHRIFPPFSVRYYALKDATGLVTGCNHARRHNDLHYIIQFASGASFDLGKAWPLNLSKLNAIELVDHNLRPTIVHTRWSWLMQDPLHPRCVSYWAGKWDSDGLRRTVKLLRISEKELNQKYIH